MGTGGVVLLSSSELTSVGKQGMLYVVPYSPTANSIMAGLDGGGYSGLSGSDPTQTNCTTSGTHSIVQCFEAVSFNGGKSTNGIWGEPAFWNAGSSSQYLYGVGLHDYMYWYPYVSGSPGAFNPSGAVQSDHLFARNADGTGGIGGTTSVTWDGSGSSTGVVWALDANQYGRKDPASGFDVAGAATLYAYPAVPGNFNGQGRVTELWDTHTAGFDSSMPGAVKFMLPTAADGYVFVAGGVPSYFGTTSCPAPSTPPFSCAGQLTILK